ncbi:MAG: hypothetical protein H7X94_12035, partial [Vallitaleaceae bacterium]|nr:hypothetical protein [Vallitaleaceae bacterium]
VRVASDHNTLYEKTISAKKVLSPNQHVMAVVTDTPDAYRFLENTKTTLMQQAAYMEKAVATDVYQAVETEELEVIFLDSFSALNSEEKLSYFDYIYLGHNQSLSISEEEERVIGDWIEAGNCFVIETGSDYEKANSILPKSLNPLQVDSTENVYIGTIWKDILLEDEIDVATSSNLTEADYYFQQEGEAVIGAVNIKESGSILTLMINFGLEPLASWNSKAPLMSALLQGAKILDTQMVGDPYRSYGGSPYQYMLQQVPVDKKTPYTMIFVVFLIYILFVAPISYFILKKMDKRDLAWITIPVMAILCFATLYIFGGNTRYTQAITNSISILTAHTDDLVMNIQSDMAIFNNQKDKLTVEWDSKETINFNYGQGDMYYSGHYVDPSQQTKKKVTGKITYGNPLKYEKYNAPLWSTTFLTAQKQIPFDNKDKMIQMSLSNDRATITVKNTTPYILDNAFLQWGQGFIFIGDLNPGEQKEVQKSLSAMLPTPFEKFLQAEMNFTPYDYTKSPTSEDLAGQRIYDFLMQRYVYTVQVTPQMTANSTFDQIKLCAMNRQAIGYDLTVNGDDTEDYALNLIEISTGLKFEPGASINIPAGIITPETTYFLDEQMSMTGSFDFQTYDQYLRFYEQGIANFSFSLPEDILLIKAHLEFSDVYGEQDYYNSQNGVTATPKTGITYKILNVEDNVWEEAGKIVDLDQSYLSLEGKIIVQVDLRSQEIATGQDPKAYSYTQMMKLPLISIEGSVQ